MRRLKIGSLIFIGLLLTLVPLFEQDSFAQTNNSLNKESIITLVNQNRSVFELDELTESSLLTQSAQAKAEDMAKSEYFSHTNPEGLNAWYWFDKVGYDYRFAGENLAVNFSTSQGALNSWMNSPTHRDNILNRNYSEIGTGIAYGFYRGKYTAFVVQHFGAPQKVVIPEKKSNRVVTQDEIISLLRMIEDLRFSLSNKQ